MLRITICVYIISFYCVLFFSTGAFGDNTDDDSSSVIQVNDGLLTVKVKSMPLKKVLEEIAKQESMEIVYFVSGEELLMSDFSSLTVEKGLKQLLRNYDYTLVKGNEKSKGVGKQIRKVFIFSKATFDEKYEKEELVTAFKDEGPSIDSLSEDLSNEDPNIREDAVSSLEALGDKKSADLLTWVLLNDEDKDVRISAADALENVGSDAEIDFLLEAIQDDNIEVSISAASAIGSIGGSNAIEALEHALSSCTDEVLEELIIDELRILKE